MYVCVCVCTYRHIWRQLDGHTPCCDQGIYLIFGITGGMVFYIFHHDHIAGSMMKLNSAVFLRSLVVETW